MVNDELHAVTVDMDGMRRVGIRRVHRSAIREVFGVSPSLIHWRDKRSEGRCRMCQRSSDVRPLTRHHLVPEGWFNRPGVRFRLIRNVAPNMIPLCRPCHDFVETDMTGRRELRRVLAPDEVTYALQVAGRRWFDRYYPSSSTRRRSMKSAGP